MTPSDKYSTISKANFTIINFAINFTIITIIIKTKNYLPNYGTTRSNHTPKNRSKPQ